LPLPASPTTEIPRLKDHWRTDNARRLKLAERFLGENDAWLNLLYTNLSSAQFHSAILKVYLFHRADLPPEPIQGLEEVAGQCEKAQGHAAKLR
jgi:hypothetical protein